MPKDSRIADWRSLYLELTRFIQKNHRMPSRYIPQEQPLYRWRNTQYTNLRNGTLSPQQQHLLKALGALHHNEFNFLHKLTAVKQLYTQYGHLPRYHAPAYAERVLARWYGVQKKAHKNGTLSPERLAAFHQYNIPLKDPQQQKWNQYCALTAHFYTQHQRQPSIHSTHPGEQRLAQWLQHQFIEIKRGLLPHTKIATLRNAGLDYTRRRTNTYWYTKAAQLQQFIQNNQRIPTRSASRPTHERIISRWFWYQNNTLYTKNKMTNTRKTTFEELLTLWQQYDATHRIKSPQ